MRLFARLLAVGALLAASTLALAETEMILLRDGTSGMADVVSTTHDSIKVQFKTEEGASGETVLSSSRLDPHCFYTVRSKHMEKTVENHVKLAVYCAEQGLFQRAKAQMDLARKLDPEIDKKIEAHPEIMQGIADRLAAAAKKAWEAGDLERAYELAQVIATRFMETTWGDKAVEALDKIEAEMAKREADEVAAREKKIAEAKDEAEREVAEGRDKAMRPIEARQESGRKKNGQGLRAKNRSTAKRFFEDAASDFKSALVQVGAARKSAGDDAELTAMLDDVEKELRSESTNAWINAGNIELWRDNYNGARKAGEAALEVDPGSSAAKAFLDKVDLARAMSGDDWGRPGGRPR